MTKRFDAVTPRPKYGQEGQVWWHRVGTAIQNNKGMITVYLDSVPVPDPTKENKIVIMLFEPRDQAAAATTGKETSEGRPVKRDAKGRVSSEDDIPF